MPLIFDASSVKIIADDGLTAMTDIFFLGEDFTTIQFFKKSSDIGIQRMEV